MPPWAAPCTPCLLDAANTRLLPSGDTLGGAILKTGRSHLWDERPAGLSIDTLIIHYMSALDIAPLHALDLPTVLSVFPHFGVSAHYLILRSGAILQLVPEQCRAWHAGGSIMPAPDDRENVNHFSIGIELMATPGLGYTAAQYCALAALAADIGGRHPLQFWLGHEEIAGERAVERGLRASAKTDPGPLFDWMIAENAAIAAGIRLNR